MNILNLIFKKKRKKVIEKPEYVNFIDTFKYKDVVQSKELLGCNNSQSLFLDAEIDFEKVGFIFIGKIGMDVYRGLETRGIEIKHLLRISKESDTQSSYSEKYDLFIIPDSGKRLSFTNGLLWAQNNKQRLEEHLKKNFGNCSMVYIFTDYVGFSMMLSKELALMIKERNQLPLLFVPIPDFSSASPKELVDFCTFYHHLLSLESPHHVPFVLLDENKLRKQNADTTDMSTQKQYYYMRIGYAILDLFTLMNMESKLYNVDFETILSMLQTHKGPYRLLYFDIYDDKPAISHVFEILNEDEKDVYLEKTVMGFIGIQPSAKGLMVEEYKNIRSFYANKDVIISVVKPRTKGAIIRGILLSEGVTKILLEQMTTLLNSIYIQVWDETDAQIQQTIITSTKDLEEVLEYKYYSVEQIVLEHSS